MPQINHKQQTGRKLLGFVNSLGILIFSNDVY